MTGLEGTKGESLEGEALGGHEDISPHRRGVLEEWKVTKLQRAQEKNGSAPPREEDRSPPGLHWGEGVQLQSPPPRAAPKARQAKPSGA